MSGAQPGTIHHLQAEQFSELYVSALSNVELRGALARATSLVSDRRDTVVASLDEWDDLRDRAGR